LDTHVKSAPMLDIRLNCVPGAEGDDLYTVSMLAFVYT